MRFLITLSIIYACVLIFLDATPCSTDKLRDLMMRACGAGRRRREVSYYDKGSEKVTKIQNSLAFDEVRHKNRKQFKVIGNDTTGGILIRHKRGTIESFMYCCLDEGSCSEVFPC